MQCAQPPVSGRGYNYFSIEGIFMQALPFLIKRYSLAKPGSSRKKMNKIRFLATFLNLISPFVSKKFLNQAPCPKIRNKRIACDQLTKRIVLPSCFRQSLWHVIMPAGVLCWGYIVQEPVSWKHLKSQGPLQMHFRLIYESVNLENLMIKQASAPGTWKIPDEIREGSFFHLISLWLWNTT